MSIELSSFFNQVDTFFNYYVWMFPVVAYFWPTKVNIKHEEEYSNTVTQYSRSSETFASLFQQTRTTFQEESSENQKASHKSHYSINLNDYERDTMSLENMSEDNRLSSFVKTTGTIVHRDDTFRISLRKSHESKDPRRSSDAIGES